MSPEPRFLRRFEQVWAALRRYQFRLGLGLTVLTIGAGVGLLAWSDHRLELSRPVRAAGLASVAAAGLVVLGRRVVAPLRWWTKPRTAVEIEGRFPQLGQRVRTVVQFAGLDDGSVVSEGVAPNLLGALQEETEAKVEPLPLDRVVPLRRLYAVSAMAATPILLLSVLATRSDEWRTALQRTVLVERPYTRLAVVPGSVLVDQGVDVAIAVEVRGRPRPEVILETRPAGKSDAAWRAAKLDEPAEGPAFRRVATLEKVKDPLEYRVVAGPAVSKTFAVGVRYPLEIKTFRVTLSPPAYTGLEPSTDHGGDIQALEGTKATFRLTFDAAPGVAALELTDPARAEKGKAAAAPVVLPLRREGEAFVADLSLVNDRNYRVVASTTDGRVLPKKTHRIDVYEDRPPRVSFEEPDEALEVHPVAEVTQRVRAGDDFGLTRTGIVFRFNDGEEKGLILKDFSPAKGKKPRTTATLEETLLMETLAASPQDSVTYYAFAEDNFPGTPRRTETDLRYIDIRAFKRQYKVDDRAPGDGEGDSEPLTTLEELVGRQRFNLNRANRLAKHRPNDRTEAEDPLKLTGFEEALVGLTREFTEGIEGIAGEPVGALRGALESMNGSIESLDRGRKDEAPGAMSEALKHLVSARRELTLLVNDDPALAAALRSFDRKQAQKIRKPKSKDEEAEQVAARIEELAADEDFVYATLASSQSGSAEGKAEKGTKGEAGEPKEKKAADPKDGGQEKKPATYPTGEKARDAPAGQGEKGKEGEKGMKGPKGSPGTGKGAAGEGESEGEGPGEPKKLDRRGLAEKQERVADEARDLEEALNRIEAASELARARMAEAAEKAEKASGALARGNSREAARDAKAGAGMLHELARQVKGEIARETADKLAMARNLAEELAAREAELAAMNPPRGSGGPSDPAGKDDKSGGGQGGDREGERAENGKGEKGQGGEGPGTGKGNGRGGLTGEERIERIAEAAKTLEAWLKQIDNRGDGKAADAVHDILEQGAVAEIVERSERMGELRLGGNDREIGPEANALAVKLEALGRSLEILHRGVVEPRLAAMVEFDRRVADLTARLGTIETAADLAAWNRDAAGLVRDLEKAQIEGAADLADAIRSGGRVIGGRLAAPGEYQSALRVVAVQVQERIQDMILKDLASARDEATPPMFREQVDRYYEVLSKGGGGK